MADGTNEDLFAEFQEFLTQKRESEKQQAESEDYDVEIWDEKGKGARIKRSHAKPFLQSLGIDIDAEPDGDSTDTSDSKKSGDTPKSNKQSTGSKTPPAGVARKYFSPKK